MCRITRTREPQGDAKLRAAYGERLLQLAAELGSARAAQPGQVRDVLDVGCATGLSSRALAALFPNAHVTGE